MIDPSVSRDKRLGLEYYGRQHPADAGNVTETIEQVQAMPGADVGVYGSDPSMALIAGVVKACLRDDGGSPYREDVTRARQSFYRPRVTISGISIVSDSPTDVIVSDYEGTGITACRFSAASGSNAQLDVYFPHGWKIDLLYCNSSYWKYTNNGSVGSVPMFTINISGTNAGQAIQVAWAMPSPYALSQPYSMFSVNATAGGSAAATATAIAAAINAATPWVTAVAGAASVQVYLANAYSTIGGVDISGVSLFQSLNPSATFTGAPGLVLLTLNSPTKNNPRVIVSGRCLQH